MKIHKISQLFYKSVLTAAIALMGIGCASDDTVDEIETVNFELTTYSLTFTDAGSQSFRLRAPGTWEITTDEDWLVIYPTSGDGNSSVELTTTAGDDKTGTVKVTAYEEDGVTVLGTYDVAVSRRVRVYGTPIYYENMGATAVSSPYSYVNMYTAWGTSLYSFDADDEDTPSHSETVTAVTYSGSGTYLVGYGIASIGDGNVGAYTNASGSVRVAFDKANGKFVTALTFGAVEGAEAITGSTRDYTIRFGLHSAVNDPTDDTWDYVHDPANALLELSNNGTTWVPVDYELSGGSVSENYWYLATSEIQIPTTSKLYIRVRSTIADAIRVDDMMLYDTAGTPTVVDFSKAVEDEAFVPNEAIEATATTVETMISEGAATATAENPVVISSSDNVSFEAVVVNDITQGNTLDNTLFLQTVDASTGGSGILLYYPDIDVYELELAIGDKLRVTLMQGEASYSKINDALAIIETPVSEEVTAAAAAFASTRVEEETTEEEVVIPWVVLDKLSDTQIDVEPIVVTDLSTLGDYESMLVTIPNVTSNDTGNILLTTGTGGSHVLAYNVDLSGGTLDMDALPAENKVTMYFASGSSNTFKSKSAYGGIELKPITGCVMKVDGEYVIAPRQYSDIADFYISDPDYDYRTVTIAQLYARVKDMTWCTDGSGTATATNGDIERLRLETDELTGESTVIFGVISQSLDGGNWAYATTSRQDCYLATEDVENKTTLTDPHTGLLILGYTGLGQASGYCLPIYVTTGDVVKFTIPDTSSIVLYNWKGATRVDMSTNKTFTCEYLRSVDVTPVQLDSAEKIAAMTTSYAGICGYIPGAILTSSSSYAGISTSTKTHTFQAYGETFYLYVNRDTGFNNAVYLTKSNYYAMTVVCSANASYSSHCMGRHPDEIIHLGTTSPY